MSRGFQFGVILYQPPGFYRPAFAQAGGKQARNPKGNPFYSGWRYRMTRTLSLIQERRDL